MNGRYRRVPTVPIQEDVERIEEHVIQGELGTPDDTCLFRFHDDVERATGLLSFAPHTGRRSAEHREFRELIGPFGHHGCVVLICHSRP